MSAPADTNKREIDIKAIREFAKATYCFHRKKISRCRTHINGEGSERKFRENQ